MLLQIHSRAGFRTPFRALIAPLSFAVIAALSPVQADIPPGRHAQAILYIDRIPTATEVAARNTHAKYEPAFGCYLGAFVDFDSTLNSPIRTGPHTTHQDPSRFEQIVGRPHAMYFFYLGYGQPLPANWVNWLSARNKLVQIALEPNDGLSHVRDDKYLRNLAIAMRRTNARIFLRFASEMNGPWTNYHRNPAEYRRKFRLVANTMRKLAPNVAMVWCPFEDPTNSIPSYYPGDDATDWVGVNIYNVTYHDNSLHAPAENEHPCDLLGYVYRRYSQRKPIMICEYGATHYAACEGRPRPDFAARKILTLYQALPRIFPRVKCVDYFDGNALVFAKGVAYNDYSVTDDTQVATAYKWAISSPYFLSFPLPSGPLQPPAVPMQVRKGEPLRGSVTLSCWVRGPLDLVTAKYYVDKHLIYTAPGPALWQCIWNASSASPGRHTLSLEAFNRSGTLVAEDSISIATQR